MTGPSPSPGGKEPGPVRIRVLGPLEVRCGATPVAISGRKERALVVLLALHAGHMVPTDTLIEALWGAAPPPSAEASLRVLVARVRRALAGAGSRDVVRTRVPGYLLDGAGPAPRRAVRGSRPLSGRAGRVRAGRRGRLGR